MLEPTCGMNKWSNNQNKLCRSSKFIEFCSWQLFYLKSSCHKTTSEFHKFKIRIFKTTSNRKTTKIKVLGIKKLWNFIVDKILVWNHLVMQNFVWILKFYFFSNDLEWKTHQNKSCRSQNVMKLYNWQFFDLKSSRHRKICLKF
jgi:hypothetical protein